MVSALPLLPIVREDIRDALAYTLDRYGVAKAREYADLARAALKALLHEPQAGHRRPDIHPDAWCYPIKQSGRNARHMFLYEIVEGRVQIYGFVYDGRDLPVQWRARRTQ